jgi:TonB family protein
MHDELFASSLRRTMSRLAAFFAASFALHVLTLFAYGPRGLPAASGTAAATVLQATLTSATRGATEAPEVQAANAASASDSAIGGTELNSTRAGTRDGLDLPVPDRWFAGREVDVRAEPLSPVTIEYPEELAGSGIAGRVQIVLFVDERGMVRKIEVARAVPEGVFEKAAVKAWSNVRFSPAMKGGVAVKSQKVLELSYSPL